ncbi:sensor histidine kinase [Micromonospora sp. HM5-17]|jgi:two-component system sensor histidine kinase UhpB|uniref:HAMP domain-containing sensor histidine kinase n=1 Tax=Micromonospora sp. HM5-17 TaxID=2487710 RepID=UPI000F47047F|nr:sensor histidine kinase [Micromonospora sp. HM5-17]ROT26802.1 sensor histidine kinase [Micromonospora sp. HM5-17]
MTDTADQGARRWFGVWAWSPSRGAGAETPGSPTSGGRSPAQALFRRLFVLNGLVFTVGTLVLALSPATVSSPVLLTEIPVLTVGLALILAVNALLLRASLAPLDALTTLMQRVHLLRTGDRLRDSGNGDLTNLIESFNAMLDRLETERNTNSAHALAAQEGERQRIARELHDEIGQSLTVVLLGLKRAVDRAPDDLREELHAVQEMLRSSLNDVGRVARRLRPDVLEDLGLLSALNALATEFSQVSGVPVQRRLKSDLPALSAEMELVIYRIAQESLTNVARHARASRVELSLHAESDAVVLRVADDGRGEVREEGAGIRGMRERALLINARLDIEAVPGVGTDVRLVVPVPGGGR